MKRYWTAMHEAGHAIMALDMGVPVFELSIVPNSEMMGFCSHKKCRKYLILDYGIAMAGVWAECWVNDDAPRLSWGDIDHADEIINKFVDSGEWPHDEIVRKAQAIESVLEKRLKRLRPQVEKLAHELMIRQTMTGDEIQEALAGEELAA